MKRSNGTRKRGRQPLEEVPKDSTDEFEVQKLTLAKKFKRNLRSSLKSETNVKPLKNSKSTGMKKRECKQTHKTVSCATRVEPLKRQSVKTKSKSSNIKSETHDFENTDNTNAGISKQSASANQLKSSAEHSVHSCNDEFLSELYQHGFQGAPYSCVSKAFRPAMEKSRNMLHLFENMSLGLKSKLSLRKSVNSPIINLVSNLQLNRIASPFDRRVTAIEWHPTYQNVLAVGSKGGDIIMMDVDKINTEKFVTGAGAGGSCQALKFWPWDHSRVITSSIDGTVTLHDFNSGSQKLVLADTMDPHDHWYCSLDVQPSRYLVAAGRNNGILHLMSTEGRKVFESRLHKNKITHVEFSPREDWLLCTASSDQTVQMWDVRMMKDRSSALHVLKHNKVINSAYFSRTDGCRLLTTDQHDEIRVYTAPEWSLETTIQHPHRFFQHITPFKATWHPHQDLIVCGRYPEMASDSRSIDLFDADTGDLQAQLQDPGAKGLCSLNKFNNRGDTLVSSMGFHILLWNRKEVMAQLQESLMADLKAANVPSSTSRSTGSRSTGSRSVGPRSTGPRSDRQRNETGEIDDLKKKKKKKTSSQTSELKTKLKTKLSKK